MMFFIHHVQTYKNVKRLAKALGVKQVHVVANKIRDEKDEEFVKTHIPEYVSPDMISEP